MGLRPQWAWVLLAALSCVEPPAPSRDGGREVPDCDGGVTSGLCAPHSKELFTVSQARQLCDFLHRCCSQTDRALVAKQLLGEEGLRAMLLKEPLLLTESTPCRRGIATALFLQQSAAWQAVTDDRQRFDSEAARACLGWLTLGTTRCAPGLVLRPRSWLPASCGEIFQPATAAGERCSQSEDCLVAGDGGPSTCVSSTKQTDAGVTVSLSGVCQRTPTAGEACVPPAACATGLFCAADRTCRPKIPAGGVCIGGPCAAGTFCDESVAIPRCTPLRPLMSPCTNGRMCSAGALCSEEYRVCLLLPDPDPTDVTFDFCLGTGGVPRARALPEVPATGGLP